MGIYKNFLVIALFFGCLFSGQSYFKIDGMTCKNGCVYRIKSVVRKIDGVSNMAVDFDKRILYVEYDSNKLDDSIVINKIADNTTFTAKKIKKKTKKKKSWLERLFY